MGRAARPAPGGTVSDLGASAPRGPVVLDTNVFINALAGRGPPVLKLLLAGVRRFHVAAPTRAELAWVRGRLDPAHPGTARVLAEYDAILGLVDPARVLVPDDGDWLAAGELAGHAVRMLAGGGRRIATAFDRVDLVSDALTAVLAGKAGLPVVTEDRDFEVLAQLTPALQVLLYSRQAGPERAA